MAITLESYTSAIKSNTVLSSKRANKVSLKSSIPACTTFRGDLVNIQILSVIMDRNIIQQESFTCLISCEMYLTNTSFIKLTSMFAKALILSTRPGSTYNKVNEK